MSSDVPTNKQGYINRFIKPCVGVLPLPLPGVDCVLRVEQLSPNQKISSLISDFPSHMSIGKILNPPVPPVG